ncbi:GTPase Grc3p-like pre-mRNA cleavage complex [Cryptosporidium ubiquitum]|uniref:GTPase Grc3p-like pre-mRNA cleavage complex n=1 Tax=Cryptosporidium ubiquitum TaxID=857276 RepID=A0A1J4MFI1_9CRYT|nr:GTPase Grc3p-like pre-mRNA cleavage complex [Cryptosporidium ubiquitum]OII73018.1 GTPase Grc3p-like pre-mRNA cleavage complex [Cryptosporidium ubiquitum]
MSREFVFPFDWREFSNLILQESNKQTCKINSVILIGPKNSGKTTFSLYIAKEILNDNRCLNNNVYILDCDLGQPLISPMSCVKLVKWDIKDIFIGNSKNINILPEVMFYIGGNSPIIHPLRYLKGLKQCFEYISSIEEKKITLILNMPGWITGVGLEIASIITAFCIDVSNHVYIGFTKEFEPMTKNNEDNYFNQTNFFSFPTFDLNLVKNIKNKEFLINNHLKTTVFVNTLSDLFSYNIQIDEIKKNVNPLSFFDEYMGYYSVEKCIPQYFCKTVHFPFNSICIIPCPSTTLLSEQLKFHIPARLTNSIVALCIFNDEQHKFIPEFSADSQKLDILDTKIILPCIGFGIVHHINYQSNSVVITAPCWIPSSTLSEVNALQLTEMMLPQNYFFSTSRPYICKKKYIVKGISSGGKVPSNRKNVKRKIHNI